MFIMKFFGGIIGGIPNGLIYFQFIIRHYKGHYKHFYWFRREASRSFSLIKYCTSKIRM